MLQLSEQNSDTDKRIKCRQEFHNKVHTADNR